MGKLYSNANILLNFRNVLLILNVIYSRCIILIYIVHLFGFTIVKHAMKKINIAYNNSLRRLLSLSKHNSASEMFVNLNILSFVELLRKYYIFNLELLCKIAYW